MIAPERRDQALKALHGVLIEARLMALEEAPAARIAEVLDWAELLPLYITAEQDKTSDFRKALAAIVKKHSRFRHAVLAFDRPLAIQR